MALLLEWMILAMALAGAEAVESASTTVESIFDSAKGVHLGGTVVSLVAIGAGAVMLVLGFRLFRVTLFVVGFVAGGVAIAIAVEHAFKTKPWVVTGSWIAFAVGGLICGAVAAACHSLGIFIAGAAGGVVLGIVLHNTFGYRLYPSEPNVVLVAMCVGLGVIFGIAAAKLEKPVLIITTSLFGAGLIVWGVGYFAGDFPSANDLQRYATQDLDDKWVYSIPTAWWAYLAGFIVLFALGVFIQFRKTARSGGKRSKNVKADKPKKDKKKKGEKTPKSDCKNKSKDHSKRHQTPPSRTKCDGKGHKMTHNTRHHHEHPHQEHPHHGKYHVRNHGEAGEASRNVRHHEPEMVVHVDRIPHNDGYYQTHSTRDSEFPTHPVRDSEFPTHPVRDSGFEAAPCNCAAHQTAWNVEHYDDREQSRDSRYSPHRSLEYHDSSMFEFNDSDVTSQDSICDCGDCRAHAAANYEQHQQSRPQVVGKDAPSTQNHKRYGDPVAQA